MSNLPVLWQNCLLQFETEIARKAWLWFAENRGSGMQYTADRYAEEVEKLVLTLGPLLQFDGRLAETTRADLLLFILTRHANWRLGANAKPGYLRAIE